MKIEMLNDKVDPQAEFTGSRNRQGKIQEIGHLADLAAIRPQGGIPCDAGLNFHIDARLGAIRG